MQDFTLVSFVVNSTLPSIFFLQGPKSSTSDELDLGTNHDFFVCLFLTFSLKRELTAVLSMESRFPHPFLPPMGLLPSHSRRLALVAEVTCALSTRVPISRYLESVGESIAALLFSLILSACVGRGPAQESTPFL